MKGIIKALIDSWLDPTIPLASLTHLSDFPRSVIADAEAVEVAFFVQVVDFSERSLEWSAPLRSVEVPHVNLISLKSLQGLFERNAKMFRSMRDFYIWSEVETESFQ